MTPYEKHLATWQGCERCSLHQCRNAVIFARGELPADVLFVGEAPGESEDIIGRPFVGPAGKLLDKLIAAVRNENDAWSYAITNLIGCIPKLDGKKVSEPPDQAIKACRTKLKELIALCRPKAIVCVGLVAKKHVPSAIPGEFTEAGIPICDILHPAAILRAVPAQQGLMIKRSILAISSVVEQLS